MQAFKESTGFALVRAFKAYHGAWSEALTTLGLYAGQDIVLRQLWAEEGLTQSDLVERLHVEPPTVSKMLDRMERAGLVERRRDPEDARLSRVYLTDRGRGLEAAVQQLADALEERAFTDFTLEERLLLRRLLRHIQQNLA